MGMLPLPYTFYSLPLICSEYIYLILIPVFQREMYRGGIVQWLVCSALTRPTRVRISVSPYRFCLFVYDVMYRFVSLCIASLRLLAVFAPLAQLDRASDFESGGLRFDPAVVLSSFFLCVYSRGAIHPWHPLPHLPPYLTPTPFISRTYIL